MKLDALAKSTLTGLSARLFLVGYLPTYAAALFILVLIWAGAPGDLRFARAWQISASLGLGETVFIALGIVLVTVVLQPLQLRLVRILEGEWPSWAARLGTAWQRRIRDRLARAAELPPDNSADLEIQRAGRAGTLLATRFPTHHLRPTALGNVLAAMEESAGAQYGWDAVVAWPRLYPSLDAPVRAIVDEQRNGLDAAVRLTVTAAAVAPVTAVLLMQSGWWLLLAAIPAFLSGLSYSAAFNAAMAYREAVHTAFDLHRFDLLDRLHLPLPADQAAERPANEALCDMWRQGVAPNLTYRHPRTDEDESG
ncbi:hypothetical protein [Streptomyces sp. ok210]|jgi:hypothetical protein|uniref:hypothetical protein n=1 Tax=Streptomyces sp. ok210 TaxID=1761905 RepID=UPI0008DED4C4|nr:hypothetical protein [Streptomyces sp. ok210]SFT31449.1 hypothetical protein SAMN04487982_11985 [Streptomyces sp. ok210]